MAGGGGDGEFEVSINLTALLDVLTNLLFFLMFGFAAAKASMELDGKISLPESTAQMEPKKSVQITLAQDQLRVEKEVIAQLKDGQVVGIRSDAPRIEPLLKRLSAVKKSTPASGPDADVLLVLCDKDTPYNLLRRVLMTAAEAGYPRYRMAVLMK